MLTKDTLVGVGCYIFQTAKAWGLTQFLYMLTFAIYNLCGGLLFQYLEGEASVQALHDYANRCAEFRTAAFISVAEQCNSSQVPGVCNSTLYRAIEDLDSCLRQSVPIPSFSLASYSHASIYAFMLSTTIGLGMIYPTTVAGKTWTIIFSIFGIPIFLAVLSEAGNSVLFVFVLLVNKVRSLISRQSMNCSDFSLSGLPVWQRKWLPLVLALAIVSAYACIMAGIFKARLLDWSYFDCFYFTFQCISLIGMGDVFPEDQTVLAETAVFTMFGIILVAMCFHLLTDKLLSTTEIDGLTTPAWKRNLYRILSGPSIDLRSRRAARVSSESSDTAQCITPSSPITADVSFGGVHAEAEQKPSFI